MRTLLAALLLSACVSETTPDDMPNQTGATVLEQCGEEPKFPPISPTFETVDGQDRVVLQPAEYDALQFFLGIDALWRSCARDL